MYEAKCSRDYPAYIIFLLDFGASMALKFGPKQKIEILRDVLRLTITEMIQRSVRQAQIIPRYQVAMFAYNDSVFDVLGGFKSVEEIAKIGIPKFSPHGITITSKGFSKAEEILHIQLPYMANSPAPLICHITGVANNLKDATPIAKRILSMGNKDGYVMIENICISKISSVDQPYQASNDWQGFTAETKFASESINALLDMSSTIPECYRQIMCAMGYDLRQGTKMMLPSEKLNYAIMGLAMSQVS